VHEDCVSTGSRPMLVQAVDWGKELIRLQRDGFINVCLLAVTVDTLLRRRGSRSANCRAKRSSTECEMPGSNPLSERPRRDRKVKLAERRWQG